MNIIGPIIEIILYVEDMAGQVSFYRDVLELNLGYPQNLDDYSDQMWVTFDIGFCILALDSSSSRMECDWIREKVFLELACWFIS